MIVRALVEQWPHDVAIYIHELPGLIVAGATLEDALDVLPDGVEAHIYWLASHGFDVAPFAGVEIDVAEQLAASQAAEGPLFVADCEAATPQRIEATLQVAALARRDLVDLYRSVSIARRDGDTTNGDWSIADHLRHVAGSEVWYVDSLGNGLQHELPRDPLQAMKASASYADSRLRSLNDVERQRVFERSGQQWTASKAMRRMVGHLREHHPWVQGLARR